MGGVDGEEERAGADGEEHWFCCTGGGTDARAGSGAIVGTGVAIEGGTDEDAGGGGSGRKEDEGNGGDNGAGFGLTPSISSRSLLAKGTMFATRDSKSKSKPSMTASSNGRGALDPGFTGPKTSQIL